MSITTASRFLPNRMAFSLRSSASAVRSSRERTSRTWPGGARGFARRAMASLAACAGSRTQPERDFGATARGARAAGHQSGLIALFSTWPQGPSNTPQTVQEASGKIGALRKASAIGCRPGSPTTDGRVPLAGETGNWPTASRSCLPPSAGQLPRESGERLRLMRPLTFLTPPCRRE